jgi:hypothetical protein
VPGNAKASIIFHMESRLIKAHKTELSDGVKIKPPMSNCNIGKNDKVGG